MLFALNCKNYNKNIAIFEQKIQDFYNESKR